MHSHTALGEGGEKKRGKGGVCGRVGRRVVLLSSVSLFSNSLGSSLLVLPSMGIGKFHSETTSFT